MFNFGVVVESKMLKSYKGFLIEKSWEVASNGKIVTGSILYTAYTSDGNGLVSAATTLVGLKKRLSH